MHFTVVNYCNKIKSQFPEYFIGKKVLDVGSLDINGSNKHLFTNCEYTGLDVAEGPNVDIISISHQYQAPDNSYDVIISTEVFEHDMFWEKSLLNITRMLKPGGLFLFTCAAPNRQEHGTRGSDGSYAAPLLLQISEEWSDYYRNLSIDDINNFKEFIHQYEQYDIEYGECLGVELHDLYFYGFKK
jgi:SAM-dependent methyltransferase